MSVTLENGRATTTYTAPSQAGVATIRVQINNSVGTTSATVRASEGQVSVSPDVMLADSRSGSDGEDPIEPEISVTNIGPSPHQARTKVRKTPYR